jgi:hypothetical protein
MSKRSTGLVRLHTPQFDRLAELAWRAWQVRYGANDVYPGRKSLRKWLENKTLTAVTDLGGSEIETAFIDWANELLQGPEIALASSRFDRWLRWLPSRMVSKRIQTEVVGDGLERIGAIVQSGGSRWQVFLVSASVALVVLCEIVRYVARSLKGRPAS